MERSAKPTRLVFIRSGSSFGNLGIPSDRPFWQTNGIECSGDERKSGACWSEAPSLPQVLPTVSPVTRTPYRPHISPTPYAAIEIGIGPNFPSGSDDKHLDIFLSCTSIQRATKAFPVKYFLRQSSGDTGSVSGPNT